MKRKLRMAMVGGGKDSYIGSVHRQAAAMHGKIELACGAFSSRRQKSLQSGLDIGLPSDRVHATYRDLLRKETKRPEDDRIDIVSIVTPNNMHYPVAMASLDAGFHVICDKPMTMTLEEATNLERKVKATTRLFCLTHNLTSNAMVQEARKMISKGRLGNIRRVVVEYPQGWLASRVETRGNKQASWRTDPRRVGPGGCMADIGSHCSNLAEYITGSEIASVCADLTSFVKGRQTDDDGSVLVRFKNKAHGVIWATQVALGAKGGLTIRVYGEEASLEWRQQSPGELAVHHLSKHSEVRRANMPLPADMVETQDTPQRKQTESNLECFADLYDNFADAIINVAKVKKFDESTAGYPTVHDGVRGMAFLEAVAKSSKSKDKWIDVKK
jgi:predicted dehydrogenase